MDLTELDPAQLSDLLSMLPPAVVDSLSPEQKAALWALSRSPTWRRHPINIRLSMPIFGRRFFLTLVGGSERRSADRLRRERRIHRLSTIGNLLFLAGVGTTFLVLAAVALALFRSVVAF